jgi:hypothetical protein
MSNKLAFNRKTDLEIKRVLNMLDKESLDFAISFGYDEWGSIINPGKFERECAYVPYFWNLSLNGVGETITQDHSLDTMWLMSVSDAEREEFLELQDVDYVLLWETNNGFVLSEEFTEAELPEEFRQ